MSRLFRLRATSATLLALVAVSAQAALVMPSFADVPVGWVTDRYDPASFANVGTYQGRDNVLGIGITTAGDSANRGAQSGSFYNTQGKQHALIGAGVGSTLGAGLFIESGWRNSADGSVRTDMWAVGSNAAGVTDYGIIGFTNQGGAARLRVWDADTTSGWVDLALAITYDAWADFQIELTAASIDYYVNGTQVYSDTTIGADRFSAVIMQAYNFADPALFPGVSTVPYTAHWSNIPEPGSIALMGLALAGLAAARRRRLD